MVTTSASSLRRARLLTVAVLRRKLLRRRLLPRLLRRRLPLLRLGELRLLGVTVPGLFGAEDEKADQETQTAADEEPHQRPKNLKHANLRPTVIAPRA